MRDDVDHGLSTHGADNDVGFYTEYQVLDAPRVIDVITRGQVNPRKGK